MGVMDVEINLECLGIREADFLECIAPRIRELEKYLGMHSAEPFAEGGFAEYVKDGRIIDIFSEDFDPEEFKEIISRAEEYTIVLDGETYNVYLS